MPDNIESYKVLCNGGLTTSENHLALAEQETGSATRLVNYEVSLFGGYRRINGYEKYDATYSEVGVSNVQASGSVSEGKVLGVAIYKDASTGNEVIIAARKNVGQNTYSFLHFVANVGWVNYSTGLTLNYTSGSKTVQKIRHVSFNFGQGQGNEICFVDGVNPAVIFNGTQWRQILSSNNSPTSSGPYGGPMAYDSPSYVDVFQNHLVLAGDPSYLSGVSHSAPNSAWDFTSASGGGQLAMGYDVVQIKPFRNNLFIFGRNNIKKAVPNPDTSASAAFLTESVTANVGCIATDSVVEIGGDLVFLSPDGLRPCAGTSRIGDVEIESISKKIQGLVAGLNTRYNLINLNAVVIRAKSQLRYFIGDGSLSASDSYGIIGGLRTSDQKLGWEFGELQGIRASATTSGYVGTEEVVLHGDYDGHLYKQEVGSTFNGQNIISIYSTPYLDFGDTEVRKKLRKINAFVRAEGPLTLGLSFQYDWGDDDTPTPASYEESSIGSPVVYNSPLDLDYGEAGVIYGGSDKPVFTTSTQGSGFSVRCTFVSEGNFNPHSIQGFVYEFTIDGRR
jgi:hypothetical protein